MKNINQEKKITKRITKLTKSSKKFYGKITGRNNQGRITVRHKGGGNKKLYRIIDFRRTLFDIPGIVKQIEYDPNRSANIALINYKNGMLSYIIAPKDLKKGSEICAGPNASLVIGNAMPLENMPIGTLIHNIEMKPGRGGKLMRAAGTFGKVIKKDLYNKDSLGKVVIRLNKGKLLSLSCKAMATIGVVSNESNKNKKYRKAGQSRWLNKRPSVRGVAKNPVDHPHGGGEGKSKGGRHPVTPWGKLTKGKATSYKRISTKYFKKNKQKQTKAQVLSQS